LFSNGLRGVIFFITTAARPSDPTHNFCKLENTRFDETYLQGEEKCLAALPSDKRLSTELRYNRGKKLASHNVAYLQTTGGTLVSLGCEGKVALVAVNNSTERHLLEKAKVKLWLCFIIHHVTQACGGVKV
jgi:hypothetical protein